MYKLCNCKKTKIENRVKSFSEIHLGFNMQSEVYYSEFIDITVLIILIQSKGN